MVLSAGGTWVATFEQSEQLLETDLKTIAEHAQGPDSTRVSARLGTFDLQKGTRLTFELCMLQPPADAQLQGAFDVAIFGLEPMRLLLRVPLDPPHMKLLKRNDEAACLPLGGGELQKGGLHGFDLVWPSGAPDEVVLATRVWGRVLVRRELPAYGWYVVLALGVLTLLFAAIPTSRVDRRSLPLSNDKRVRSVAVALALLVGVYVLLQIPTVGSTLGFVKGVAVALIQVVFVVAAIRFIEKVRGPFQPLALHVPERSWLVIPLALAGAVALSLIARRALELVPSTGVAPIESFIAWPSGTLALALIGVVAPVAEEIFFRGYLYAVFRRWGEWVALALTTIAFTIFHLAQSWGNWGGVTAIAVAGIGFGVARFASGSVWVAALVHVAYNLALSFSAFFGVRF